jgi:hypothetical protein
MLWKSYSLTNMTMNVSLTTPFVMCTEMSSKNPCTTQEWKEMLRNNKQNQHEGDNTMQSLWWIQDWSRKLFEPKLHYM